MKFTRILAATLALSALSLSSAFAAEVDTSLTYNSGILVLAFAGFLALVVVAQTVPAFINLYNMIKKTAEETKRQEAKVTSRG